MNFIFEFHKELLVITPALGVSYGEFEDLACESGHWLISFSWFFWTAEFYW